MKFKNILLVSLFHVNNSKATISPLNSTTEGTIKIYDQIKVHVFNIELLKAIIVSAMMNSN